MPDLKINGVAVSVEPGATVLEAAQQLGVDIPTLCHLKGTAPQTSCMLCVVKECTTGRMLPACSTRAANGMEIDTGCGEVRAARRDILNLLLSEHAGDCEAPCTRICPAHLDIPHMLREIQQGRMASAAQIARRDLAIPAILGYICPAPCEKGCRRGQLDTSIPIRNLHRKMAEEFPAAEEFPKIGKNAAVIGSGAAGLACAWKLRQLGWACTIFDEGSVAGGSLREEKALPPEVLEAELRRLQSAGIEFRLQSAPAADDFDAVLEPEEHRLAVKAVANGKAAAEALAREGSAEPAVKRFDSKLGKLRDSEVQELMKNCPDSPAPSSSSRSEALRCLHCDCRKPMDCKLRRYAEEYGADPREYPPEERSHLELYCGSTVVFEPGKCIKCGLCVRITERAGVRPGLAFTGRSSVTRVSVPFGAGLDEGLKEAAAECAAACPTGALAVK